MAKERSIGALWSGKEGSKIAFTGVIELDDEKIKIVVFENSYKESEKHPDYRIFKARERNQDEHDEPTPF